MNLPSSHRRLPLPVLSLFLAWLAAVTGPSAFGQPFVNFEGKQTSPIRLSPDGTRLFAVNTPDNRLSVFDVSVPQNPILIAEIPVGLEPVSVNPISNDEAWVVNEVSDSVSVVSVSRRVVTDTIYVKDEPADIAFANGRGFVTASRNNRITVIDVASHVVLTNIPVFGENPRAIVASPDGTKVFAAFALSGNRTTLVSFTNAPAQPTNSTPPMRPGLPPPPKVSLIVDATDPAGTAGPNAEIKFTMPDNDVVEINTATLAVTRYFPRVGTVNLGIALRPGTAELYVANTDARNLTRFEPALRSAFVTNQVSRVDTVSGAVTKIDLDAGFNYTTFPSPRDQTNALAQPTALAFSPGGQSLFIAGFGSDRIGVFNTLSGTLVTRVELNPSASGSIANPRTKRGPRGLALRGESTLYVLNRIANTISVVDAINPRLVGEIPIGSHDPTPAVIRQGRGFLYDAKLSGNGTVSCASCHIDSDMDLLAWDLGDPQGNMETVRARISGSQLLIPGGLQTNFVMHPMKGPMTTQTLRGLQGTDPLHWRGDRTNFLHFNHAFDGLLGGSTLSAADMQLYRDYINTIRYQPNPNQNLDRTLPARFQGADPIAGRNAYMLTNYQGSGVLGLKCNTCHAVPTGTDRSITPAAALQEPQDFKVPQLRNMYQKMNFNNAPGAASIGGFGLVHDGQDPNLFAFLSRSVFGAFANDAVVKSNVSAFVLCFDTGTAPAVGYARTLTAANIDNASVVADWNLLEAQARSGTNINLIIKGTIDGKARGFVYSEPQAVGYRPDSTSLPFMTRAQLRTKVLAGDTLTIMGVPVNSGVRMGIDRNLNGILDGDEPVPALRIVRASGNAIVAWPTNAAGYVLERTTMLAPLNWATETSVRGVNNGEFTITNPVSPGSVFFRLRGL